MGKMLNVFAFDPGSARTGFCYLKSEIGSGKADIKIKRIYSPDELAEFLKVLWGLASNPDHQCVFVIENYRVTTTLRGNMFEWDDMQTSQLIGAIRLVAAWTDSKVFMQEPAILGAGRKWWPKKLPKHIADDDSATIHGIHFLFQRKMIMTVDDVTGANFGQGKFS